MMHIKVGACISAFTHWLGQREYHWCSDQLVVSLSPLTDTNYLIHRYLGGLDLILAKSISP